MHTRPAALLVLAGLMACGGSSPAPTPTPTPTNPFTVTIAASGVSPKEVMVPPGTRVLFVNNDTRRHDMSSDNHPDHQECPAINAVGALNPGQRRETGNLNEVRTCGFHDHDNPANTSLQGRIVVR